MRDHNLDATAETKSQPSRQAVERQTESPEARGTFLPQHDPLAQAISRAGNVSSADAHASSLNRATSGRPSRAGQSLLELQRRYGNRYVQRILDLARKGTGKAEAAPEVEGAIQQKRGGGQALDKGVQGQMESAFGADFGDVRVHTDIQADTLNRELNARAFTTGQDIFFRQDAYNPGNSSGRELIAHELTHVVQQNGDKVQRKLTLGQPGDKYEQEADEVARAIIQKEQQSKPPESEHGHVGRQPEEGEEEFQMKAEAARVQRQVEEEEEEWPVQTKLEEARLQQQGYEEQKQEKEIPWAKEISGNPLEIIPNLEPRVDSAKPAAAVSQLSTLASGSSTPQHRLGGYRLHKVERSIDYSVNQAKTDGVYGVCGHTPIVQPYYQALQSLIQCQTPESKKSTPAEKTAKTPYDALQDFVTDAAKEWGFNQKRFNLAMRNFRRTMTMASEEEAVPDYSGTLVKHVTDMVTKTALDKVSTLIPGFAEVKGVLDAMCNEAKRAEKAGEEVALRDFMRKIDTAMTKGFEEQTRKVLKGREKIWDMMQSFDLSVQKDIANSFPNWLEQIKAAVPNSIEYEAALYTGWVNLYRGQIKDWKPQGAIELKFDAETPGKYVFESAKVRSPFPKKTASGLNRALSTPGSGMTNVLDLPIPKYVGLYAENLVGGKSYGWAILDKDNNTEQAPVLPVPRERWYNMPWGPLKAIKKVSG